MKRNLNIYISFEEEWAKLTRKNAFSGQQFVKRPEPFILDPDTSSFFVYSNISQKRMKKTDKERRQELLIVKLCEINFRPFRGTTTIIFSSTKRIFHVSSFIPLVSPPILRLHFSKSAVIFSFLSYWHLI